MPDPSKFRRALIVAFHKSGFKPRIWLSGIADGDGVLVHRFDYILAVLMGLALLLELTQMPCLDLEQPGFAVHREIRRQHAISAGSHIETVCRSRAPRGAGGIQRSFSGSVPTDGSCHRWLLSHTHGRTTHDCRLAGWRRRSRTADPLRDQGHIGSGVRLGTYEGVHGILVVI